MEALDREIVDRMEVEGAVPRDARFDKPREYSSAWNPNTGFERSFPENLWPLELVSRDEEGHVWVDFNTWKEGVAPDISYPELKRSNVPYIWTNPTIMAKMAESEAKMVIDDQVLAVFMPVAVYTPLLFLMLNGTRRGGSKINRYNGVVSVEHVIKCYSWARMMSESVSSKDAKVQLVSHLAKIESNSKLYTKKIPNLNAFLVRLQQRINADGLAALTRDSDGQDGEQDWQVLQNLAYGYLSEMFLKINSHEVCLIRILCPRFNKLADFRRFHVGSGLPIANPSIPAELLAPLDPELMTTALEVLKMQAIKAGCLFIVPKELVLEPRICGIPAHFLRVYAAIPLFDKSTAVVPN